jgi:hypothetical protein
MHEAWWQRRLRRVGAVAAAAVVAGLWAHGALAAPLWTPSRYMDPVSTTTLYNLGYELGQAVYNHDRPQDAVVVLDYGAQSVNSSGEWGAISVHSGAFHTMAQLRAAVQAFGRGYYYGTGSNTTAQLAVELGTNNSGRVGATAGQVWANAVDAINSYFASGPPGFPFSRQVTAAGANDFEPGFCKYNPCPDQARAWADYFSTYGNWWYDNYGSCDGCPPVGSVNYDWQVGDIYHVSYGATAAFPLPEIYANNGVNAAQWERISEWGLSYGRFGAMDFDGSMTQHYACSQVGCDSALDNTPEQGWTQLWNALNTRADYDGHVPPAGVHDGLEWSTDIRWTY